MRWGVLTVLSISKYMQYSISLVGERMCYLGCVIHAYHPCQHMSAVWNPLQNEGLFSQKFVAQRLPSTHFNLGSHVFCPNQSKDMQINKKWHPTQLLYKKDKDCSKFWATPWLDWRAPQFWIPVKILNNNSELYVLLTCVCQSPYFPTFFVICRQASRAIHLQRDLQILPRARKRNFSNWKLIVVAIWVSCCAWSPPKWPQSQQQTGTLMSLPHPSIRYCNCIELVYFPQYSLGAHNNPQPLILNLSSRISIREIFLQTIFC